MPLIIFEGPKMETETKRQLVRALAEAVSRVTGHPQEIITTVIHENPPENIGPGGELLADRWASDPGEPDEGE